ncbi:MAG: alpha/beta hydrolase [Spirochaetaceae bacterium]
MSTGTLVCLHGFGVRGYFFEIIAPYLRAQYRRVLTPDLRMDTLESVLHSGRNLLTEAAREEGAPVAALGHSLGGVVAALAARDLGPNTIDRIVLVAPPFGENTAVPGPVVRFLLKHKLIPDFLTRPQFFSSHTPKDIQKSIFRRAVDETPELQAHLFTPRRFHTDMFEAPLHVPALVTASEADKIVPVEESRRFAERLGAELAVWEAQRNVGHDDLVCSPTIAAELAERITLFTEG